MSRLSRILNFQLQHQKGDLELNTMSRRHLRTPPHRKKSKKLWQKMKIFAYKLRIKIVKGYIIKSAKKGVECTEM